MQVICPNGIKIWQLLQVNSSSHRIVIKAKKHGDTQEWHRIQQMLPQVKKAWEQGQKLFLEAFDQAKSNQENMEYLSQIDFAVDCYAYVSASRAYPDSPT